MNRRGFFAWIAGVAAAAKAAPTTSAKKGPTAEAPIKPETIKPFEIGVIEDVPLAYAGGKPVLRSIAQKRIEISAEDAQRVHAAWDLGGPDTSYETRITGTYHGKRVEGDALITSIVRWESVFGPTHPPTWEVELLPQKHTFRPVQQGDGFVPNRPVRIVVDGRELAKQVAQYQSNLLRSAY